MEDPKANGSARHMDSAPTKQDGMGYHASPEVRRKEKLSDFDLME